MNVLCRLRLKFWFVMGWIVCVVLLMVVMWWLIGMCCVCSLSVNVWCGLVCVKWFMCLLKVVFSLVRKVLLGNVVCWCVLLGV